ncbi:MAG: glycerophosphodiester phosphodiesterase [Chlorobi bacterium]|nr:glycerophosphodiester phosphodiesterase [Chlorobiota bacterium]
MQKPLIIAHRGESFDAPENTLAAINLAWEKNDDAVEIDIQLTKDNKIVVFHDYNTKRICGVDKRIESQTLAELKLLDAGNFKNIKFRGEKIPTLNEVLNTIPSGKKLIIEIKSDIQIIPFLKRDILYSKLQKEQIEFISFNLEVISSIKKELSAFVSLWLLDLDYNLETSRHIPDTNNILKTLKVHNLNGVDCWAGKIVTKKFVEIIKQAGYKVYLWTIDDIRQAEYFLKLGVDGITTNRAHWIINNLPENLDKD